MKFSEFTPLDERNLSDQQVALVRSGFSQEKPPGTWVEIAKLGYMVLRNAAAFKSVSDQDLVNACVAQVYQMMHVMGGGNVYFNKGERIRLAEKNKLVASEFNGKNYNELARKHGLSVTRIRQIVEKQASFKKAASHQGAVSC